MSRHLLLLPVIVLALFAASSPAALADYGTLWSQPVTAAARLVAGDAGATVVWAVADGAGSALVAQRYDRGGEPLGATPVTLVNGIAGLSDWLATSDGGSGVVVAWKAGGVTSVRRVAADGAGVYDPVTVCSDAAVAALRGSDAAAVPLQIEADGLGGVYVRLLATPSLTSGDTLLAYVSPLGMPARPDPGLAVQSGTVAYMSADDIGQVFALLSAPGRRGVAVQRFTPELTAEVGWPAPISPYNPLLGTPPATPQTPVGIVAASSATTAWREGARIKVQRFTAAGDRVWLRPAAVSANGATTLADDAWGGCYLASASPDGLRVQHIGADGVPVGDPDGSLLRMGLGDPRVNDVSSNHAGDLAVAYGDAAAAAGVAHITYLGTWSRLALGPAPSALGALEADGGGGVYALGEGAGARLWRLGEAAAALTLRPRAAAIVYGEKVGVAGYLTHAGVPLADTRVEIRWTSAAGITKTATTATTDGEGFYEATIAPTASVTWTAAAAGPGGEAIVSEAFLGLHVAPEVSITLANRQVGGGYVEIFSGAVKPAFPGSRVLVQRRSGGAWRTVATDRLDGRSRYRVSWHLPLRSATYLFRTLLPASAGYEAGVSRTARLRVVLSTGG